jgi:hypothetical protein
MKAERLFFVILRKLTTTVMFTILKLLNFNFFQ